MERWKTYLGHTNFDSYFDQMCYCGDWKYSRLKYAKEKGYEILEWSDYMQKEFTKADLKDGMVIECRNKARYLLVGDRALRFGWHNPLSQYEDDLTNSLGAEYGIEKVFKVKNKRVNSIEKIFDDKNLELIWERTETKHMTTEEMRQKLEELTGEKIEVEPSRKEMIVEIKEYCCGRACRNCCIVADCENLNYSKLDSEKLKQCYEKVMEDGRKES